MCFQFIRRKRNLYFDPTWTHNTWPQYIYRWNFIFVWVIVCTVKTWYIKWVIWCTSTFHAADVQDIHHNCHKQSNYISSSCDSCELLNCANINQVWVHLVRERIASCKSSRRQSFSKVCTVNSSGALNKHPALIQNCETTQTFHWSNIVFNNNNLMQESKYMLLLWIHSKTEVRTLSKTKCDMLRQPQMP